MQKKLLMSGSLPNLLRLLMRSIWSSKILSEITAVTTLITLLPEDYNKISSLERKARLEYKKFVLENRRESYGAIALLENEMDLGRIHQELEEVNKFITLVEQKMSTLKN